jgi:hypothetical protein
MDLENDRRLMLVDPGGVFLTQREHARMALVTPVLKTGRLTLSAAGMSDLSFEICTQGKRINTEIWSSSQVESIDQGDLAAEWLSDFLKLSTRLVRTQSLPAGFGSGILSRSLNRSANDKKIRRCTASYFFVMVICKVRAEKTPGWRMPTGGSPD